MKPHPAFAVPLIDAGRRQNLTTEYTEKKYGNYSAHLNPAGSYTREKPFYPQISQMGTDFKKYNSDSI
jgi:hypothetical protein